MRLELGLTVCLRLDKLCKCVVPFTQQPNEHSDLQCHPNDRNNSSDRKEGNPGHEYVFREGLLRWNDLDKEDPRRQERRFISIEQQSLDIGGRHRFEVWHRGKTARSVKRSHAYFKER